MAQKEKRIEELEEMVAAQQWDYNDIIDRLERQIKSLEARTSMSSTVVAAPARIREFDSFYKATLCRHWMEYDQCYKGNYCLFGHGLAAMRCYLFARGQCPHGTDCKLSHKQGRPSHVGTGNFSSDFVDIPCGLPKQYKVRMCRQFKRGNNTCYASGCAYAHGPRDICC